MSKFIVIGVGAFLFVLLVLYSTSYTVRFNEVAVKTSFGKATTESVQTESGLRFKIPLAQSVAKYDRRSQLVESPKMTVNTSDGQQVVIGAFLMWRINASSDESVFRFAEAYESIEAARDDLDARFVSAIRDRMTAFSFDQLIGPNNQLAAAEQAILDDLEVSVGGAGVEPVAVGISQVLLPTQTTTAVLRRMKAVSDTKADTERNKGQSEADGLLARANSLVTKLQGFTEQRVAEIKAEADMKAAVYLERMGQDEEFAIFLAWLDGLRDSLGRNTTIFLGDGNAPFHLMKLQNTGNGPIPLPRQSHIPNESPPPPTEDSAIAAGQVDDAALIGDEQE